MTSKNLIASAQRGNDRAQTALYEKYYGDVYRYCAYRVGSLHYAEDLAQDTFLRFFRYNGDTQLKNVKAYILKIASNVCTSHLSTHPNTVELGDSIPDTYDDMTDDQVAVRRAISALPDEYREVIILYYYNNMNTSKIAQMQNIPVSTVKTRLSRAREKLKTLLIKEGF